MRSLCTQRLLAKRLAITALGAILLSLSAPLYAQTETSLWRFENVENTVVFADVHGAYKELTGLLQANKIIDASLQWIAGKTHLVSVGDLIDQGNNSRKVLDLLMNLQRQAARHGGRLHVLAGNHELMNLLGQYHYVSPSGFAAFSSDEIPEQRDAGFTHFLRTNNLQNRPLKVLRTQFNQQYPAGYFAYQHAFSPQGKYGQWLLTLPAIIVINNTVFTHGGLPEITAQKSLDKLNKKYQTTVARYLTLREALIRDGVLPFSQALKTEYQAKEILRSIVRNLLHGHINKSLSRVKKQLSYFVSLINEPMHNINGPLWYRASVLCRPMLERPVVHAVLENLQVKRAVVGHTPTKDARVHQLFDGKLIMLDTGMLQSLYSGSGSGSGSGRAASLRINQQDQLSVLYTRPIERGTPLATGRITHYGLTDQQLKKALLTGPVDITDRPGNRPWPIVVTYQNKTIQALFYPDHMPRQADKELATYAISELIELDIVPITVARTLNNLSGAVQLQFPEQINETERLANKTEFDGWCSMQRQADLSHIAELLFDKKTGSTEDIIYDKQMWQLYRTNFNNAYSISAKLPRGTKKIPLPLGVADALQRLTYDKVKMVAGQWLTTTEINALLSRRDQIVNTFKTKKL